jgi:hypothetical protein
MGKYLDMTVLRCNGDGGANDVHKTNSTPHATFFTFPYLRMHQLLEPTTTEPDGEFTLHRTRTLLQTVYSLVNLPLGDMPLGTRRTRREAAEPNGVLHVPQLWGLVLSSGR